MNPAIRGRPRAALALLVSALLLSSTVGASAAAAAARPVKVMTRNLYLGVDVTPVLLAHSFEELASITAQNFRKVQATDFPARAEALAREIEDADPDLIGLQEVSLYRTGDPGVLDGPATPATTVYQDFLAILRGELGEQGLEYVPEVVQAEMDVEIPSALGFDIRLTQRDVILARRGLPVSNPMSGNFAGSLSIETIAGPLTVLRGWTSVDTTVNRRTFRFVNTHLEAVSPSHRFLQSAELLAPGGPANTALPVVLVGDLNSSPAEEASDSAYANLLGGGFVDTWTKVHPSDAGFTCCNADDLLNPAPTLTERIDHVLIRPAVGVVASKVVGIDQDNRTPSGLWPSDHAGVVATLTP